MLLPFEVVVCRGAVLLWEKYVQLDDPARKGQSKSKYFVVVSQSPLDDPIIYVLTTSKEPSAQHPWPADIFRVPAGTYAFFPLATTIDAGTAGQREVGTAELRALYDRGSVVYQGTLRSVDLANLMAKIGASPRVSKRVKSVLGC